MGARGAVRVGLEPSAAGPTVGLGFRLGSGGFGRLPGAENRGSGAKKLVFELISIFSEAPGHFPSRNTPSGSTPTALRAVPRWAPGTLRIPPAPGYFRLGSLPESSVSFEIMISNAIAG